MQRTFLMAHAHTRHWAPACLAVGWTCLSCGEAEYCTAEQLCPPYYVDRNIQVEPQGSDSSSNEPSPVESGYAAVIEAVCENVCAQLEECSLTLFTGEASSCEASCVSVAEDEDYWSCEPLYRSLIDCYTTMTDCDASKCEGITTSYITCRDPEAEVTAADSCILAFNGECDEPERCLAGSDTTDCASMR